jgi:hypothetical protein
MRRWILVVALASVGCSTPSPEFAETPTAMVSPTSGTPLEQLFPLIDEHMYHYATESDDGQGMLVARVQRDRADGGSLEMSGGTKRFGYKPDGIVLERTGMMPVYVLKQPLSVGTKWRGEHGGWVEVAEVSAVVNVPAGTYQGCVKTVEQRGGDMPLRVATTFCPDIGIVVLEAASGGAFERAVLKSYGPPVELGPDGITKLPSE